MKDFLDEMIAERTARNPDFPKLMANAAVKRHQQKEENRMSKSNQARGPMFQDAMDPSRMVQPREDKGGNKICGIFWKTKNGLVYGGEAACPINLFASEADVRGKTKVAAIGYLPAYRGTE